MQGSFFVGWAVDGHWHVDGHGYRHFPHSPEIGLIPIFIFNDMGPQDGGTVLSRGSHLEVRAYRPHARPVRLGA